MGLMKSYEAETWQVAHWSGEPKGHVLDLFSDHYFKGQSLVEKLSK